MVETLCNQIFASELEAMVIYVSRQIQEWLDSRLKERIWVRMPETCGMRDNLELQNGFQTPLGGNLMWYWAITPSFPMFYLG